jgi:ferredoxin
MARIPYVDQDVCISCNLCADTTPEVFRMNDDGLAEVYDEAGASEERIQEAMDVCPVTCIHWQ